MHKIQRASSNLEWKLMKLDDDDDELYSISSTILYRFENFKSVGIAFWISWKFIEWLTIKFF